MCRALPSRTSIDMKILVPVRLRDTVDKGWVVVIGGAGLICLARSRSIRKPLGKEASFSNKSRLIMILLGDTSR